MDLPARLAVLERVLKEKFSLFLKTLGEIFENIVKNNGSDYYRKVNITFLPFLHDIIFIPEVVNFLECIRITLFNGSLILAKEVSLEELKICMDMVHRKIFICFGGGGESSATKLLIPKECYTKVVSLRYMDTSPFKILNTTNPFLINMEDQLNFMQCYEDPDVLAVAKSSIPTERLNLLAIERMRLIQHKIKKDKLVNLTELGLEEAIVIELLQWFKESFFNWVDSPLCHHCNSSTHHERTIVANRRNEICRVEIFRCSKCHLETEFPRYRDPLTLLLTRRGRCGEWASCFTLLLRALGYDARFVADTNDHVWNEFYSHTLKRWIHVDSCEKAFDTPLMYESGWKKKISYVIAYGWDDIQDVTWRYSSEHALVKSRRNNCDESQLVASILALRASRPVTPTRRKYLAKRQVEELCQLLVQPTVNTDDCKGRTSGSLLWRLARNETFEASKRVLQLTSSDNTLTYISSKDIAKWNGSNIGKWNDMLFESSSIARKVEADWKMAYLARTEGSTDVGELILCFEAPQGSSIRTLHISVIQQCYEDATIKWSISTDNKDWKNIKLKNSLGEIKDLESGRVYLRAELSGGRGDTAWQHAQIARQSLDDLTDGLYIKVTC